MPTYLYTARDREGKPMNGYLDAVNQDNALASLQGRGILITSIAVKLDAGVLRASRRRKLHNRVTLTDQVLFCRQLATMLNAGVPLLRGLEVLRNQVESRRFLVAINDVIRDVESGHAFRDSLSKHPNVFSPFWLNVVETGEASGHLGQSLDQLADYLDRSKALQEKMVSALLYPGILILLSFAVVTFFAIVVIPMFQSIFAAFNTELPTITMVVVRVSAWLRHYFLLLIIGGVAIGWMLKKYFATEQGRWFFDRYSLRIPILGTLLYDAQIARFASGLSTLMASGVPILFALEILERSADNRWFAQAFGMVKHEVREGKPMAAPLETTGLFPPMVVQMVQVGEEIGEMSSMLERIAAYYEARINRLTERLSVLFEPIALIFVGGIVGFLVIALFLPLFDLSSVVKG